MEFCRPCRGLFPTPFRTHGLRREPQQKKPQSLKNRKLCATRLPGLCTLRPILLQRLRHG